MTGIPTSANTRRNRDNNKQGRSLMLTRKESPKNESKNSKNPSTATAQTLQEPKLSSPKAAEQEKARQLKTKVTIKYDAGFPNQLYIRGKGANLSWDKGMLLKNTKPDEWVWETDASFNHCEFKILINDNQYEEGDNHLVTAGATIVFTPCF